MKISNSAARVKNKYDKDKHRGKQTGDRKILKRKVREIIFPLNLQFVCVICNIFVVISIVRVSYITHLLYLQFLCVVCNIPVVFQFCWCHTQHFRCI